MKVKKIISFIFLSLLLVLTGCFNDKECKHESTTWIIDKEATCIEEGLKHEECNDCHEKLNEEIIEKTSHDLIHYEKLNPTCTTSGYEAYDTCKNCEYTTYKEIEVLGHDESDWIIDKAATCLEKGLKHTECNNCHEKLNEETINALGHNYEHGECTRCNKLISKGLEYKLNEDKKSYRVVGIGICTDTEIVIPDTHNKLPVTVIDDSLFESIDSLLSIEIPSSIIKIGNMSDLENIEIGTIYYSGTIEDWCNVTLNSSIFYFTKNIYMLNNNKEYEKLTEIALPDTVTKVEDYQFVGFQNVIKVTIPNSVKSIGEGAFGYCIGLKNIEIPNSVTSVGEYAFAYCSDLTNIFIPNSVTSIGGSAFSGCSSLISIEIPNSVTSIGEDAFWYCSSLISVVLPITLTSIGDSAFYNCSSLTSIEIPNSVTSIGEDAFWYCSSLVTIINNSDLELTIGRSDFGYIAYYAYKLINKDGSITYKEEDIYTYIETIDNFLFRYDSDNNYQLVAYLGTEDTVTLPDDINGNSYEIYQIKGVRNVIILNTFTSIGDRTFSGCSSLTSIEIPSCVTSIGDWAFYDCTSLENVYYNGTIEDWRNITFSNWSSNPMYYANHFYIKNSNGKYEEVTEIEIPNTVTYIGNYQFCGFNNVTKITIPNSVTTIGWYAFYDCSSLDSVYYEGTIEDWCNITFGDQYSNPLRYAKHFFIKNSIGQYQEVTEIEIPDTITKIGNYQFSGFNNVTKVTLSNSITSIGFGTFMDCSSLDSVYFDGTIEDWCNITFDLEASNPMYYAKHFYIKNSNGEYEEVTEIEIPNTVTYIGNYQFCGFNNVTKITIPNSVTTIGWYAFYDCSSLTIYCEVPSKPSGWSLYWNSFGCSVVWNYLNPYKITYILNGGTNPSNAVTSFGENGLEYSKLPIPTKEGYDFIGWYLDKDFLIKTGKLEGEDVTLYARWHDEKTGIIHNILYYLDGGILPSDAPTEFDEGSGLYELPIPTKEGYTFLGWSPSYIAPGITEDVILTATWEKQMVCKITYVVGNGTLPSNAPTSFEAGVGVTLVDAISNDLNVTFLYWADEKGNAVTRINSHTYMNKTLTAMYGVPKDYEPLWELNQIGFDGKGMTYEIKVDDICESDPFDPGYTGSEQTIRQEHQDKINSAYNINILYSNYGDEAPWGPERVSWINEQYMVGFGNVYAVEIYSEWIPTLVKGGSIAELYNMNTETGIFTELSSKDGKGYEQDDLVNLSTAVKGKVYGYETGVARPDYFMYYNADKVKELGLEDPAELWMKGKWTMSYFETWVKNAQPKLKSGEYVLDMGFAESIIGLVGSNGYMMASTSPARLYLANKNVIDRISWLQDAYQSGLYYPRGVQEVSPGFQSSSTLLHHGSLGFLKDSTRFNPLVMDFTIGVVPYPTADGDGGQVVTTTDVNEAISLGDNTYLTDDEGNYIKTVDMLGSDFQVPYTGTDCYSITNINNGKNGITSEIATHILNDLIGGLGDDPNKVVNLTADESYRNYLEGRLDREIDVEVIMSCQGKTYFEIMELLSMTVGGGTHFGDGGFWPLAASIVKSTDSAVTALNEVLAKYKAAMNELGYNIY